MKFAAKIRGAFAAFHNPLPGVTDMATISKFMPKSQDEVGSSRWFKESVERSKTGDFTRAVIVTPALAAAMLQDNNENRYLSERKIREYASDMIAGRWSYNMEPIIIATTGELNDGQHRLQAVVESNSPQKFLIAFGAGRETRTTVDQGMGRTAGHYLAMEGVRDATLCAGIAKLVMAIEKSGGTDHRDRSQTHAEIVGRVKSDARINDAASFVNRVRKFCRGAVTPSQVGACYYLFANINEVDADAYLTQVCVGENIKRGDPAFAVRNALYDLVGEQRLARVEIIMHGWVAFRQRRKLARPPVHNRLPALI